MFAGTAFKIAFREIRSAPAKFGLVVLAVAIGIAILTGVQSAGGTLKNLLIKNARQLIAADLQVQVWALPTDAQVARVEKLGHAYGRMTRVTETVSMAGSLHTRFPQMISVKAVDPAQYPYYGDFRLQPAEPLRQLLDNDHSVIVTPELEIRLKVKPGDVLRIGGHEYDITGTIESEPDRLASGFGPGMRVIMTRQGLDRTGLIQFGSRAAQRFLFKLKPAVNLDALRSQLKEILPHSYLTDYQQGSPAIGRAVDMTTGFLSLVSLISLIVGSLGVGMAMYSHLKQRMDSIAIMKAVGARSSQVISIYLIQTVFLGVAGACIGTAAGSLVQRVFPLLIHRYASQLPPGQWSSTFTFQGLAVGVLATLLFALPPLLSLRQVKPALIFRREMSESVRLPLIARLRGSLSIAVIIGGVAVIARWLSGSWISAIYFLVGLAVALIVLGAVATLLLWVLRRILRQGGPQLPSVLRHGLANVYRPGNQARAVLVALGVGVMFTITTYLLQRTVLHEVEIDGPGREGNLFLLDIHDARGVQDLLSRQPGVQGKMELAGYIVARMVSRNGLGPGQMGLAPERRNQTGAVRITTATSTPEGIELKQGHWWLPGTTSPQLAVSQDAQKDFHLELGDRLTFQIAGRMVQAPLVAIFRREERSPVRYDLVFPERALAGLPVTYFGAVHAKPDSIPEIEAALFDAFPTVTAMDLADVLNRIEEAVNELAMAIRFVAAFAIAAGAIILASSIAATRYRRVREVAILKTLGATRGKISAIYSAEFTIIGAVAGLIGALLANFFTQAIARRFLETDVSFNWLAVVAGMVLCAVLANIAGWLASARTLSQKPLEALRHEYQ